MKCFVIFRDNVRHGGRTSFAVPLALVWRFGHTIFASWTMANPEAIDGKLKMHSVYPQKARYTPEV